LGERNNSKEEIMGKPEIVGECVVCGRALVEYRNPDAVRNWSKKKIVDEKTGWLLSEDKFWFWLHRGYGVAFVRVWMEISIPPEIRNDGLLRRKCPECSIILL
jgi:hypothetical protein